MKKIFAIAVAFGLSGCATWGQFDKGLSDLIGKPLSYAVDRLGLPSSEAHIADMHLVKWQYTGSSEYSCRLTLQIDEHNMIVKSNGEGSLGGCEQYINALKK